MIRDSWSAVKASSGTSTSDTPPTHTATVWRMRLPPSPRSIHNEETATTFLFKNNFGCYLHLPGSERRNAEDMAGVGGQVGGKVVVVRIVDGVVVGKWLVVRRLVRRGSVGGG